MPLEFVGQQGLRWAGGKKNGGQEIYFNGTYARSGTTPAGSACVCPLSRARARPYSLTHSLTHSSAGHDRRAAAP
jgi:hypothetical protein